MVTGLRAVVETLWDTTDADESTISMETIGVNRYRMG